MNGGGLLFHPSGRPGHAHFGQPQSPELKGFDVRPDRTSWGQQSSAPAAARITRARMKAGSFPVAPGIQSLREMFRFDCLPAGTEEDGLAVFFQPDVQPDSWLVLFHCSGGPSHPTSDTRSLPC
jgi:hypothetical protein